MARMDYAEAELHGADHRRFLARLEHLFAERSKATGADGIERANLDLIALLGSWWEDHIKTHDTRLAEVVRARKGGGGGGPRLVAAAE